MLLAPLQDKFLHAPGFALAHDDLVGIAAVHHVDDLETRRQLAGMAELAHGGAVQLGLVDLSGPGPGARSVAVGVGVGHEKILVRALGDAVGPGGVVLGIGRLPLQIVVQHHIAVVAAVGVFVFVLVFFLLVVGLFVFFFVFAVCRFV